MSNNNWYDEFEDEEMNASKNVRKDKNLSRLVPNRRFLFYLPWFLAFFLLLVLLLVVFKDRNESPVNERFQSFKQTVSVLEKDVRDIKSQLSDLERVTRTLNASLEQEKEVYEQVERLGRNLNGFKKEVRNDIQDLKKKETAKTDSKAELEEFRVKRGDTLYSLAGKYEVTVEELRKWNDLEEGQAIYPGQKLYVKP